MFDRSEDCASQPPSYHAALRTRRSVRDSCIEHRRTKSELKMTSSHLRIALGCLVFLGILAAARNRADAIPRFSLISGTRCSACHFNPQGGGLRTELGWESMNEVGAWRWP